MLSDNSKGKRRSGSAELSFLYHNTQAEMLPTWGGPGFTFPEEKKIKKKTLIDANDIQFTTGVAFMPSKTQVAYTLNNSTCLHIKSLNNLKHKPKKYKFPDVEHINSSINFFPDGNRAVISFEDHITIDGKRDMYFVKGVVYDINERKVIQQLNMYDFRTMAFSADGSRIADVILNSPIIISETTDFSEYTRLDVEKWGSIGIPGIAFLSADTKEVVFVGNFQDDQENRFSRVCIWDTTKEKNTVRLVYEIGMMVSSMAISRNRDKLAVGFCDGSLYIFNVSNPPVNSPVWTVFKKKSKVHANKEVTALCFSPDGNSIVSGGADSKIYFWDFNRDGDTSVGMVGSVNGSPVTLAISDDQTKILSDDNYGSIYLWTIASDGSLSASR